MAAGEFHGKVAVITGASGGIGSETARMLASRGASVALLDLNDAVEQATRLKSEYKVDAISVAVDVTDPSCVADAFAKLRAWCAKLDICLNAAGIFPFGGNIDATDPSVFDKVIKVNLHGVFHCLREEIKNMLEHDTRGSIVNISSDAGSVATIGCSPYVASKHAINGLTKSAALEYAKQNIRVCAVAPGNIATPMIQSYGVPMEEIARASQPTGRCGTPEEVAELICFLLSDRSRFMTGAIVAIDGGITTSGFGKGTP